MRLMGAVSLGTSVLIMCAKSLKKSLGIRRIAQSRLYCVVSWRVNARATSPPRHAHKLAVKELQGVGPQLRLFLRLNEPALFSLCLLPLSGPQFRRAYSSRGTDSLCWR